MKLATLEMTDFGPYRGVQQFHFADQPGIELLWGENGRGKTSFLNALRWALFGVVLGRASSQIDPSTVGNRDDTDSATVRPFKATLSFTHDGNTYKLTRAYRADADRTGSPSFRATVSLVKDGDVLGPDERERELARLLPEQIARFFLFDAELLQEYEQLLIPGSDAGEKLKASIERVLGLPVLTQARDDVATQLAAARTAQAKAAQKDKATLTLGNDLQLASDEVEHARTNVAALADQTEDLQNDVNELEKQMTSSSRFRGLLVARNAKKDEVERLSRRSKDRAEELTTASGDVWRAVLAPLISEELTSIETQSDLVSVRLGTALAARQVSSAISTGICPTCQQTVGAGVVEQLDGHGSSEDADALQTDLSELRSRRNALRNMRADGDRIARIEEEANQARVDLSDAEGQLRDLQAQMDEAPEGTAESIGVLIDSLGQKNVSLVNTRNRLKESREDLQRKDQAVAALSEKLRKLGIASTGAEDRKVELLTDLHALLVAAVTEFRDRLRDRIEDEASKVFRALSAERDYHRLRINDNYGLTILHADGTEVLNRSSGYEHVVALSLIAALQRCSPMSGPIITDSPFGRLDATHKKHVLQTLPEVTEQVVLLVHDDELDRQAAINELNTKLVGEHYLRRVSARHTEIEAGGKS